MTILSACQILGPDTNWPQRTLPRALDLPDVTLPAALHDVTLADSVNVSAYVTGINVCPPKALCVIADGISIAENRSDPGQEFVHLPVDTPQQFAINRRYRFSMRRSSPVEFDGTITYHLRIIGYD